MCVLFTISGTFARLKCALFVLNNHRVISFQQSVLYSTAAVQMRNRINTAVALICSSFVCVMVFFCRRRISVLHLHTC